MKKLIILTFLSIFAFSCTNDDWKGELEDMQTELDGVKEELANQKKLIEALQKNATISGIEQGNGSYTIKFSDGQSITLTNGKTPLINIGENGNWFIDGQDTGKPSKGENGKVPNITIDKNGNWFIDGKDSGVKAQGVDGKNGVDGKDSPYITSIVFIGNKLVFKFSDESQQECPLIHYSFKSETWEGKVKPKQLMTLTNNYIRKNTFISCHVVFEHFQSIKIGRGLNNFQGYTIEITDKDIKLHNFIFSDKIIASYEHNLIITNDLKLFIDFNTQSTAHLRIYAGNTFFEKNIRWWAGGALFIENLGSDEIKAKMSFSAKDANQPIWILGDSYLTWTDPARWPMHILKWGYRNWLADHLPGAKSSLVECFINDLNYGTPKYAINCLGMNDKSDTDNVDREWLRNIKEFINRCEEKGITPILSTIPSTPLRNHRYKSEWIRQSGYRYIDISRSVSLNDSTIWIEGMLSKDKVHPTPLGAEAMANQVLIDFPEITIN